MIYLELFWTFFKIGAFTFGGGYAMLPLIQSEVIGHKWLSTSDIINFIAVSEGTPGPFAVNISTYVGRMTGGVAGAFCATLGVVLPSFLIILMVAGFYQRFKESKMTKGAMSGLRPAVVGLIAASLVSIGKEVLFTAAKTSDGELIVCLGIFIVMSVLALKKIHPIVIIALSAASGVAAQYILHL